MAGAKGHTGTVGLQNMGNSRNENSSAQKKRREPPAFLKRIEIESVPAGSVSFPEHPLHIKEALTPQADRLPRTRSRMTPPHHYLNW